MFGVFRTVLALMVMMYHLFFIGWRPLGLYAVFGFYMISGYLMTLIMHESYGYSWKGRRSFAINRFLRLYPQYWAAALISILLIIGLGVETTFKFNKSLYLPSSIADILHNVFLAFTSWFPILVKPRLVPPTWALTIELFFYLLICLGISKTFFRVKIWLFLSICYVVFSFAVGMVWSARYFPVMAASLPFAIGSTIYFVAKNEFFTQRFMKLRLSSKTLFVLMLSNCLIWMFASRMNIGGWEEVGFYLNVIICALLVFSLATGGVIFSINRKLDKAVGDYSYPIYLLHVQSGIIASYLIFAQPVRELSMRGFMTLIVSMVIVVLISTFFIRYLDKPVQLVRTKIKAKQGIKVQSP